MPRPPIPLEAHKEAILNLHEAGSSIKDICTFLQQTHDINSSSRTIRNRLNQWNAITISENLQYQSTATDKLVSQLVRYLNTKEILQVLKKQGIPCSISTLSRIRQRLGIKLRIDDPTERERQKQQIEAILQEESDIGDINTYGRRYQYIFLRSQGHFFARDSILDIYRTINPDAIKNRGFQRRKGIFPTLIPASIILILDRCLYLSWSKLDMAR